MSRKDSQTGGGQDLIRKTTNRELPSTNLEIPSQLPSPIGSWKLNDVNFRVSGEWIQGYMVKEKNAKKIVKSFMTHILINITSPPENIRKFTIRTSRNTKSGYEELPADVTHEIIRLAKEGLGFHP
ncbi:hypothetical protein L3Y34_013525 [Caenorhabditis briggsae]|uniref:Uncharacterized protein n=1 Tax=Caenorhabditis briggsae TaxID=6238 RepID=A0AAE8ZUJ8_CAEBR|nr:hypothetical protein L3Y34_013525 [Caenorhabditis briggsae]